MNSYREYPIRCKSCNEQLACYSDEYENLVREYAEGGNVTEKHAIEKALNKLGIMSPCSRINMMNPIIITFNNENRELIEGLRNVDTIDKFSKNLSFKFCNPIKPIEKLNLSSIIEPKKEFGEIRSLPPSIEESRKPVAQQKSIIQKKSQSSSVVLKNQPLVLNNTNSPITLSSPNKIEELISPEDTNLLSGGTNLTEKREKDLEFKYPTIVGIPTINSTYKTEETVYVGSGLFAEVLNGRTYIAR